METESGQGAAGQRRLAGHARRWALAALVALAVAARIGAVFTASVNWDEFALLSSAQDAAQSGVFRSGGRPGLAVLALLPFVAECEDEIRAIRQARLLWLGLTLALLAGLGVLVAQLQRERGHRVGDAVLAVGLLALVPAFLEWSIQVRTDQMALAGGLWGGAALLASRRHAALALGAGALFALGYAASQKLAYVGALCAALALGQLWLQRELRPRREALRALLCMAGFAAVWLAFGSLLSHGFDVPEAHSSRQVMTAQYVSRGLDVFGFYRNTIGYSQYRAMLPTLAPHLLLLAALLPVSFAAIRGHSEHAGALLVAWVVLALGTAVAAFHAAAFFYFWMTLGLFPAVALALARRPILEFLPGRARALAAGGFWLLLAVPAALHTSHMLHDSQAVQRESLRFVHRNFAGRDGGFHPESGLFCRGAEQPLPTYFSWTIYREFAGPQREANSAHMVASFRKEPIKFIVQSFRLNQFPVELRRFWAENYQPYRSSVFVAGRRLEGTRGDARRFSLIVPGAYRWLPFTGPQRVQIGERLLAAGEVVQLEPGDHTARFVEDVPGGMLVLALAEPPGRAPQPFYKVY